MTILESALKNLVTEEMMVLAKEEGIDELNIHSAVSTGHAVIMKRDGFKPVGIGTPFRTKINVNIGTSSCQADINEEIQKAIVAETHGADTISDLSMGGNIDEIRRSILASTSVPITTVPIYQAVVESESITNVSEETIIKVIRKQIDDGVSSIVLHAGFSLETLHKMKGKRIMGIVSKGGSFTASIMNANSTGNPFFKNFDYILDMVKERDVVINLGNAMRSGCIHDEIDDFQLSEIRMNARLAKMANERGVQVILEGLGGHVKARDLMKWIKRHKELADDRPLFVSGPLPIDVAVGYDHVAAAIGGAFASGFGADYLCAITPAEHLRLPTIEDIKQGLIACRIAAHVGDSMKFGLNHLFNNDLELARQRFLKNWDKQFELSMDPEEAGKRHVPDQDQCSMCGKYCALSISRDIL